nr:phosphotransferase [Legionella spiritensis]
MTEYGDLYWGHLMFDNNDLVGIIDWGQVGINHPAVDIGIVFSFYPTDYHQAFFDVYGEIDSDV